MNGQEHGDDQRQEHDTDEQREIDGLHGATIAVHVQPVSSEMRDMLTAVMNVRDLFQAKGSVMRFGMWDNRLVDFFVQKLIACVGIVVDAGVAFLQI